MGDTWLTSAEPASWQAGVWDMLRQGAERTAEPFRWGSLATVDAGRPRVRTVVLRDVDTAAGWVMFHTDLRSPKAQQLSDEPEVELVFADRVKRLQVRVNGLASSQTGTPKCDEVWEGLSWATKQGYATERPPGELIESADEWYHLKGHVDAGKQNFSLITVMAMRLDILHLRADGHRRAIVRRHAGNEWKFSWATP